MGAFSVGLSAKLVMRFGIQAAARRRARSSPRSGSLLFARAPVDGNYLVDVLPAMILLGLGAGIAFNPVLLAAMSDVEPSEAGLASGVVNTAFMMGGALGLAVLASLAASRTDTLQAAGDSSIVALTGGYHLAFLVGAVFAAIGRGVWAACCFAPQLRSLSPRVRGASTTKSASPKPKPHERTNQRRSDSECSRTRRRSPASPWTTSRGRSSSTARRSG